MAGSFIEVTGKSEEEVRAALQLKIKEAEEKHHMTDVRKISEPKLERDGFWHMFAWIHA